MILELNYYYKFCQRLLTAVYLLCSSFVCFWWRYANVRRSAPFHFQTTTNLEWMLHRARGELDVTATAQLAPLPPTSCPFFSMHEGDDARAGEESLKKERQRDSDRDIETEKEDGISSRHSIKSKVEFIYRKSKQQQWEQLRRADQAKNPAIERSRRNSLQ